MTRASAIDKGLAIKFVYPSKIKKRSYDMSLTLSDGLRLCAETKCKCAETEITLRTIERSMSIAKGQLPEGIPGIVFVKVPRNWIDDEKFADFMYRLAERSMIPSPWIVWTKYYTAQIVVTRDLYGEIVAELNAFREITNERHKFRRHRERNWDIFPTTGPAQPPPPGANYNGMPPDWQRLFWPVAILRQ